MSETVRYKGTLELIPNPLRRTLEQLAESIVRQTMDKDLKEFKFRDTWIEVLCYDFYEEYYVDEERNKVYKLESEQQDYCDDFYDVYEEDGVLKFHVCFYNGACCLDEAIEYGFKKFREKKENETNSNK